MTSLMIDRAGALDRDDALHVQPHGEGWRLTVHVTDLTRGFPVGGPGDAEARQKGWTTYRGGYAASTMLPRQVESRLSLASGRDCLAVTMDVSPDGAVQGSRVERAVLEEAEPLAHAGVVAVLGGGPSKHRDMLAAAERMALAMMRHRREGGALAFYDLTRGWATNDDGQLVRLDDVERNIGYIIVQESMIAANQALASWAILNDVPILFRNHVASVSAPQARELTGDLESALLAGTPAALAMVRERLSLVRGKATYGARVRGHYALTLAAYAHGTSPLRRYADLVTQRQVAAKLSGSSLPYSLGELEKIAEELNTAAREREERRSEALKNKAHRGQREQVAGADSFAATPSRDLSGIIKRAAKDGLHGGALAEEVRKRASQEALTPADLYHVLLVAKGEHWKPLQQDLLNLLAERPQLVVSVLNMHTQVDGGEALTYETSSQGPPHAPVFTACAIQGPTRSHKRQGPTSKIAQQQAALCLLSILLDLEDPSRNVTGQVSPVRAKKEIVVPPDTHPVSALTMYQQQGLVREVTWNIKQAGPPHSPVFTAWVSALSDGGEKITKEGKAANKAGAKEKAAAALLAELDEK